ncbi:HAMP domain-containing protein [Sandaracinobacteroides saxicola]|uniref:histidine kinase n=1 Tax=Sandaracinobacteroides saxicola TaxID=2759707 RepID=A0A7G5IM94_9SPHN|nr:HAMP domain-containing protein [Sandaracinobacteroides saxicola]
MRRSLFARILLLVLATLAVAQGINLAVLTLVKPPPILSIGLTSIAIGIESGGTRGANGRLSYVPDDKPRPFDPQDGAAGPLLAGTLARQLGLPQGNVILDLDRQQNGKIVHLIPRDAAANAPLEPALVGHFVISVKRPDGRWLIVQPKNRGLLESWEQQFLLLFLAGAVLMLPAAWLFARRLAEPFRALAAAADRLGRDPSAPPPRIDGPIEVQRAAHAFTQMQQRLRAYVDDRTQMVGAIAHDLRTPLTRLAFRIENLDEPQRDPMARDVAEMEAMVAATMAFVRGANEVRERQRIELGSLVERVADDMAITGRRVQADAEDRLVVEGDPVNLRRLFNNLFDNAEKFGASARARAYRDGRFAIVDIDDDGPGLPQGELERVFEPFYRTERSRNRETGGIGLGLSVVRTIARAHGGDVLLENRTEGGLRARVTLPLDTSGRT